MDYRDSYEKQLREIRDRQEKFDFTIKGKTVSEQMESILTSGLGNIFEKHGMHLTQQNFTNENGKSEVGIGLTYDSKNYPDTKLPAVKFEIVKESIVKSIKKMQLDFAYDRANYSSQGKNQMKVNNERVEALHFIRSDIVDKAYVQHRELENIKYREMKEKSRSLKPKEKTRENTMQLMR